MLHLIRHGQGFHNVAEQKYGCGACRSWEYEDAHLTERGWKQAHALGQLLRRGKAQVDLVVVSPLTRAIETAVGAFGKDEWQHGSRHAPLMVSQQPQPGMVSHHAAVCSSGVPKFLAVDLCRETLGVHPCDKRRDVSHYKQRFPAVDFSLIDSEADVLWHEHKRERESETRSRGMRFPHILAARPQQHIAVVSYGEFLYAMLSNFEQHLGREGRQLLGYFDNCEMKSVML